MSEKRPVLEVWAKLTYLSRARWVWYAGKRDDHELFCAVVAESSEAEALKAAREILKVYCPNCDLRYLE